MPYYSLLKHHQLSYHRLVEETDTEIHIDPKGMEVPGTECVYLKPHPTLKSHGKIVFENGRTITVRLMFMSNGLYFEKCTTDS